MFNSLTEDAMQRKHRRSHIWSLAGFDSFCKRRRVNVRRWSVPLLTCMVFGRFLTDLAVLGRSLAVCLEDSTMCVAFLTDTRLKIIQNETCNDPTTIKNDALEGFGILWATSRSQERLRLSRESEFITIWAPLGRFGAPCWTHWILKASPNLTFPQKITMK